jgi:hypothetical protein
MTTAGEHLAGFAVSSRPRIPAEVRTRLDPCQPFCLWPEELRRAIESDVLVSMAASVAELTLTGHLGRQEPAVAEQAAELIAAHPATEEDLSWAQEVVDAPSAEEHNDVKTIAKATWTAHGRDLASAGAWLEYMTAQTRALVSLHADQIVRLGDVLADNPLLSGEAIAAMLRAP